MAPEKKQITRRQLLRGGAVLAASAAIAACQPKVVEKIVKETVEVEKEKVVKETVEVAKTVVVEQTVVVQQATPKPAYEKGELSILICCSGPDEQAAKLKFNERFMASRPGVTVKQEPMPAGQNYFEKLQTVIAAGTAPDIYDMWEGYVQPYAKNGALLNLEPFLDVDTKLKKTDLWPGALGSVTYDGKLYSMLIAVMPGPVSVYYNKKLLDAAGVAHPNNDWKWDDLRAAAKKLTVMKGNEPERYGLVWDLWFVPWLYWIWSNGGDVFNADETKCTLTDAKASEALQYWADMVVKDKVAPTSSTLQTMQGSINMFKTDQVALYLGNCWDLSALKDAQSQGGLDWGACLAPKANDGNRTFYQHTWCWGIWTGTKKPNLAWEYVRDFVTDEEMITQFNTFQKAFPAVKSLLHTFLTPETEALGWAGVVDIVGDPKKLRYPGAGAKWDKISTIFQAEIDLIFTGDKPAAQAAVEVCPKVNDELARS